MRTARIRKTADTADVLLRECAAGYTLAPKHSCPSLSVAFDRQDRGRDDQKTSGYGTDI